MKLVYTIFLLVACWLAARLPTGSSVYELNADIRHCAVG
jgi:hypothetical protein